MRQAFTPLGGTYVAGLDYNADQSISNADLNQVRPRYLESFAF
jgi:hypothetical protein